MGIKYYQYNNKEKGEVNLRPIKFRGYSLVNMRYVEGVGIRKEVERITEKPNLNEIDSIEYRYYIITDKGRYIEVDPFTIGQFTGMFDKNNKPIWEGDYVKYNDGRVTIEGKVYYRNFCFRAGGVNLDCFLNDTSTGFIEIIKGVE